jgi:GNAT superfamily N-acetyltransferase
LWARGGGAYRSTTISAETREGIVHVSTTSEAKEFAAAAGEWLARRPVENNLLLSHALDPAGQLPGDGPPTFAWVVDNDDEVVGAAWTQPPYRMSIAPMPADAAAALADEFAKSEVPLPGVNGAADTAAAFAARWTEVTGQQSRRERDQWLMRCEQATRPAVSSGQPRLARPDEAGQIAEWFAVTMRDSGLAPQTILRHTRHMAETQAADQRLIVWEDDGGVAGAAGWAHPLHGVVRPSGVFVSPERRSGGYAAALLGEVTARALEHGCDACVCTHYLAYAAMQAVVEKVGYRRVLDVTEYRFD